MTNFQKINLGILNIIELYNIKYNTQIYHNEVWVGVNSRSLLTYGPTKAIVILNNLHHFINLPDTNFTSF